MTTQQSISRRTLMRVGGVALASGAVALARPGFAFAEDESTSSLSQKLSEQDALSKQIVEAREKLSVGTDLYYKSIEEHEAAEEAVKQAQVRVDDAQKRLDDAQQRLDDAQKRLDDHNAKIHDLQKRLASRMRSQYKTGDIGVFDVLLSSSTFQEFSTRFNMFDRLNSSDAALVEQVKQVRAEIEAEKANLETEKANLETEKANLETEKANLEAQEDLAREKMEAAEAAKDECEKTIEQLTGMYDTVSEETQRLVEQEQERALASTTHSVQIIGNPRNIEPTPAVVDYALSRLGCPYIWGAAGPDEFDCSGLVVWAYAKAGITGLPHYTESLYALALGKGAVVKLSEVEPGDVLYRPGHVGIAIKSGGVPYVHAPTFNAKVRNTDSLSWSQFVCALRFPK